MPIVAIKQNDISAKLGKQIDENEFDELCWKYGLELDEVTSEFDLVSKERGEAKAKGLCKEKIFKVELPANRYDLLCNEGLSRALMIFNGKMDPPRYQRVTPNQIVQIEVDQSSVDPVRPFVVGAILRNIEFNAARYDSFIELQTKLHQNLGRKRTLVAIGTHDLDSLEPPFRYEAREPDSIRFRPLSQSQEYTATEMMQLYSTDSHLKQYLHIIKDKPLYPVILDSNNVVLSMPPIINGEHSKISVDTKNVFIECTGTDLKKTEIVLDTIVTMFSEYCASKYKSEAVRVVPCSSTSTSLAASTLAVSPSSPTSSPGNAVSSSLSPSSSANKIYPLLDYRHEMLSCDYLNKNLCLKLKSDQLCALLTRMGLPAKVTEKETNNNPGLIEVEIPPTRHDVLHKCDILEDVAIAFGYDNLPEMPLETNSIGFGQPLNNLTELLRLEIAQAGFSEVLTFALCSRDDVSANLLFEPEPEKLDSAAPPSSVASACAVRLSNPKTFEFQVVRTSLIPGILRTIGNSKKMRLPIKIFEIQDVVLLDDAADVGAKNNRRICAAFYAKTSAFEVIHGLLDRVMQSLCVRFRDDGPSQDANQEKRRQRDEQQHAGGVYHLEKSREPFYIAEQCTDVMYNNRTTQGGDGGASRKIGSLGVLHPLVLRNFDLAPQIVTIMEIELEPFL